MKETPKDVRWFGFAEDKVFGEIMSNKAFCKHILQGILPEIPIKDIHSPKKQEEVNDSRHQGQKDVRLDILVEDIDGNLYNVEMQQLDNDDLARRMRYYVAKNDQRYTLGKGYTYKNLKNVIIIFLCTFRPKKKVKIKTSYLTINKDDHADILHDGLTKIIINSNGIPDGTETDVLLNLVKLMKNLPVYGDELFDAAQRKINSINADPEWRDSIMDYETKMLEREQEGEEKGRKEGLVTGVHYLISVLRDYGETNQGILQRLKQKYGNDFSDDQLKEFLK